MQTSVLLKLIAIFIYVFVHFLESCMLYITCFGEIGPVPGDNFLWV